MMMMMMITKLMMMVMKTKLMMMISNAYLRKLISSFDREDGGDDCPKNSCKGPLDFEMSAY